MIRYIEYAADCNAYRVFFQDGNRREVAGTVAALSKGEAYHWKVAQAIAKELTGGKQERVAFKHIPAGFDYDQQPGL